MTDEKTPEDTTPAETSENTNVQESVNEAHQAAQIHFKGQQSKDLSSPTYQEVRADAERAADIAQNLHNTIATATPKTPVDETMRNDSDKAAQAQNDINSGADPLAAYAGYSAYAVPQPEPDGTHRNYYENPLTYDEYSVSENKKGLDVKYNLTEIIPGKQAAATNDPNLILGSSSSNQSFSYNEHTSGNNTIVTTEYTVTGSHTPSSVDINQKNTQLTEFENKKNFTYVYDKDKRLVEKTYHSESNNIISDSHSQAHKGQDMSGAEKGYFRKTTEVTAIRGQSTRFAQTELSRDGQEQKVLSGWKNKNSETYSYRQGENYREASHHQNDKGEWIYEGSINKVVDDNIVSSQELSPALAEKEFNRLKGKCNHELNELTDSQSLDDYASRLGSAKPQPDLGALWKNVTPTQEDREQAEQANAEFADQYANKPAAIAAIRQKTR